MLLRFKKLLILVVITHGIFTSCSRKSLPQRLSQQATIATENPEVSVIRLPISVNLTPVFKLVEQSLQLEYQSSGWPDDFEEYDCDTRYMYSFQTSALKMKAIENKLEMSFDGAYKIKGSQRVCVAGKGITPWSPSCGCGTGKETPRRINISSTINLGINEDYKLNTKIQFNKPLPIDKCEVCFFKKDVTNIVVDKVYEQLQGIQTLFQSQLDRQDFKPMANKVWQKLLSDVPVKNFGFAYAFPEGIQLSNFKAINDSTIQIIAGGTAYPIFKTEKLAIAPSYNLPNISKIENEKQTVLNLTAALKYDSIKEFANKIIKNKSFRFKKSIINKNFIADSIDIYPSANNTITVIGYFSGTEKGKVFLNGTPFYNAKTKTIELLNYTYELYTKDLTLNLGRSLFKKKIKSMIAQYSKFPIGKYLEQARFAGSVLMNKELYKGIFIKGYIEDIVPQGFVADTQNFIIKTKIKANAELLVKDLKLPELSDTDNK